MIKKTIKYTDFNGAEQMEDAYFNLTKAEVAEMELETEGGMAETLNRIVAEKDRKKIVEIFKGLIIKSYGKKSEDGKRFIKTPQLTEEFSQTNAYSELFVELATDAAKAEEFVKGILPL